MQEEHDAERARQAARAALEAGRVQRAEQQAQDAERERAAAEARRMETEARRAEAETRAAAAEREAAALRVDLQRAVAAGAECAGDVDLLASESVRMAGELAQRSTVEADLRRELFHAVAELARAREALSSGDSRSLPQVHRSEPESEAASLSDGKSPPPARTLMFASMHSGPDAAVATAVVANKGDSQSPVDALAGSVLPSPPSPKQLSLPRLEEDLPGPAARTALRSGPHSSINIGENSGGGGDSRGGPVRFSHSWERYRRARTCACISGPRWRCFCAKQRDCNWRYWWSGVASAFRDLARGGIRTERAKAVHLDRSLAPVDPSAAMRSLYKTLAILQRPPGPNE